MTDVEQFPPSSPAEILALAHTLECTASEREGFGETDLAIALRGTATTLREMVDRVDRAEEEAAELSKIFELQWKADQRAIDAWRAAHPGSALVLPDRGRLVLWLLEKAEQDRPQTPGDRLGWRDLLAGTALCIVCAVVGNLIGTSIMIALLRATAGHAA